MSLIISLLHCYIGKKNYLFYEVSIALHNHEIQKRDQKENKDMSVEVFTARGCNQSHK